MSKAVTNEEVEDVLSSIRRLVSEDKRPLAGLRSAPVAAPEVDESDVEDVLVTQNELDADVELDIDAVEAKFEAERFVLTPALRVQTPELDVDAADDHGPLDLGSVARETWTQDAEDDAAEDRQTTKEDGPMVLFPEVKAPEQNDAMDALDALVHEAIEKEAKAIEDTIAEGDYADQDFWDEAEDDGASDEMDPSETQHEERSDDSHTFEEDSFTFEGDDHVEGEAKWDLQEDEDATDTTVDAEPIADEAADDEAPFFDGTSEAALHSFENTGAERAPYIPLTAKIAALEAVIGGRQQDYEPDGDEADALASPDAPRMAWEDDVELDAKGEPFAAPVDEIPGAEEATDTASEPAEPTVGFGAEDQVMDEEALRDLVSEIVRSELQGALGERITRNVRKLVRREIHRALTAQEME